MSFEEELVEATERLREAFLGFMDSVGAKTWLEAVELIIQASEGTSRPLTWDRYVLHKTIWEMDGRPVS